MSRTIEYVKSAKKSLEKTDYKAKMLLRSYLETKLANLSNPREIGSALKGIKFQGLWRYRMGDYRIVCEIRDKELVIVAIKIGHRKSIYED